MCASLCTADEMCNAYRFNAISGCILGNATQLVGVNPLSDNSIFVHINAALVPGICITTHTGLRKRVVPRLRKLVPRDQRESGGGVHTT